MGVKWTEEQQKVISLRNRNILVSAAAGSGKTAVLVQRILSKITDPEHPVDIDRLLIMTFTRAAAGEMKERLSAALEQALYENPDNEHLKRQMTLVHTAQITTIDGFCSYIIRNYFHMVGLDPGYRTAEEGELKLLREDVLKELLEDAYQEGDEKFLTLVESYAYGKTDTEIGEMVEKLYDAAMSHPWPKEWLRESLKIYEADTVEEMREGAWMELFWDAAEESAAEARELIGTARKICCEPGGPYFYEDALDDDELLTRDVERCIASREHDRLLELLSGHTFKKLSAKKDKEVDPGRRDLVKNLRDQEKEIWKELREKYFNRREEEFLKLLGFCKKPMEGLTELTLKFMERFAAKKREKNLLDFTDMEHLALEILVEKDGEKLTPTQAARELSLKYDEVMVDEYQDSNYVQELITAMVSGWAQNRKNIFMVGDVKQSIYRFRLARPELFMEKYHTYSLKDGPEQRIDLHKNFRSRPQVLSAVNYLFRQIMGEDLGGIAYDDENALYAGAVFPDGVEEEALKTEVLLIEKDGEELEDDQGAGNARELEALAIAQRIQRMMGQEKTLDKTTGEYRLVHEKVLDKATGEYRPVRYGDIAVLLRTASGWAETFGQVFQSKGIPAYTASRTGYFSAQEVVTLLNYLRICDNPLQDIPLAGVLHSPIVGCSAQELAMLRADHPDGLLYESVCAYIADGQLELFPDKEKEALKQKLENFMVQLQTVRDMAAFTPVHELILYVLKITGYGDYVKALPGGAQRGANLNMLVEKAMDYEKTSYRGLFNFVRYIEKLQKYEVDFGEVNLADAAGGAVQIMTIHKSKGLEFPVVFAAGMGKQFNFQDVNARFLIHPDLGIGVDAVLPDKRQILPTLTREVIRRQLKRESLGEELRVLYVALTRAKEKLIITGTMAKISDRLMAASLYMEDERELLPIGLRAGAKSFWSYLLPALARHPAMLPVFRDYQTGLGKRQAQIPGAGKPAESTAGVPEEGDRTARTENPAGTLPDFDIRIVTAADLVQEEILSETDFQLKHDLLAGWDAEKIYDQKIHDLLEKRFSFVYPYGYLSEMPVKLSVSELKKRSYAGEQEKEEALFFEPDIIPLIPRFIAGETEEYKGAARGTAYHRLMECLDYSKISSEEEVRGQLQRLVELKKMAPEEAECIEISDVMKFMESDLGQRMGAAFRSGQLFREQPFVLSVPMKKVDPDWQGEETVLVQGIIDAYFEEGEELVLVDYKTDKVGPGGGQHLVELYHTQLEDYAAALTRLLKKRVKEKYIYSFTLHEIIPV